MDIGGLCHGNVAQNVDELVYRTTDLVGLGRNVDSNNLDNISWHRAFTGWHEVQLWSDLKFVVLINHE